MGPLSATRTFRARPALLALLWLALTSFGGFYFIRSILTPDTGLIRYDPEVTPRDGALVFFPSAPFTAPAVSGVLPERDRIRSLNGQPIADTRDLVRAALGIRSFDSYSLQVEREPGTVLTVPVRPYFRPARADWIFELIFCVMLAVAAFALCWKLPYEPSTIPLALSVLLSLLFTCITPFSYESLPENLLANAGNISSWLLVVFAMFFPWPRGTRAVRMAVVGLVIALYAVFCVLRAWLFTRWMATGMESLLADYRHLGQLVIFSDGAAYVALAALLGSAYAHSRLPRDRRMLQWMIAGVLIAFPPYFFLDQLPLIIGGPIHQVGLGSLAQLFLSVLPLFLMLALTRGKAINLGAFLVRYGIYATLIVVTIALFGVVYLPLKGYLAAAYRLAAPLPELFAAAILVLALGLLRMPLEWLFSRARLSRRGPADPENAEALNAVISLVQDDARVLPALRLAEARSIIRGVVQGLHEPLRILAAGAARNGTIEQKEAGTEAAFFLGTLESLAGAPSSPMRPCASADIVRSAVQRVKGKYPRIQFIQSDEASATFVSCPEDLVQVISVLLENASESTDELRGEVRIRCSADRVRAVIEIEDQGAGIDAVVRRRLFKPFYTTKPGHRGLGLHFAKMIVERNEGAIDFPVGVSRGTIVRLAFPRA